MSLINKHVTKPKTTNYWYMTMSLIKKHVNKLKTSNYMYMSLMYYDFTNHLPRNTKSYTDITNYLTCH